MRYVIRESNQGIWIEDTKKKVKEFPVVGHYYDTLDARNKLMIKLKEFYNENYNEEFCNWLKDEKL